MSKQRPTTAPPEFTIAWLTSLPESERAAIMAGLTVEQRAALLYDWKRWARPEQLEPAGKWRTWLILAGRGAGKTRTGAEWIRKVKDQHGRIALVGETAADARDVMVEGESGILATAPPWDRPVYNPSKRELRWSNGAIAKTYSAEDPDQLRGPQCEVAWCDELAKFQYCEDTWNNLQLGLRLGPWPRALVTTTPRPLPLLKQLIRQAADGSTHLTRGSTYDNKPYLAPEFLKTIAERYEGTRLVQHQSSDHQ